jgi:hypothetical protein
LRCVPDILRPQHLNEALRKFAVLHGHPFDRICPISNRRGLRVEKSRAFDSHVTPSLPGCDSTYVSTRLDQLAA